MKTKFNGILTLFLAFVVQISFAQQKNISGTVSDESGPLPGVSILIKGTTKGVETNFDGKYSIKATIGNVLVFRFLGYKVVEKTVAASNSINVTLKEDASVLDEIVVTGYGSKDREVLTSGISTVTAKEISQVSATTNVINALQGKAAGVVVTAANGKPGNNAFVRIRGIGSANGGQEPLYIVDGIPVGENDLNLINSNDIKTISILKDAASASVYGSRGSNGVVVITTKTGRKNQKTKFSFNSQVGFSEKLKDNFTMMNAQEKLEYEKLVDRGGPGSTSLSQTDKDKLISYNHDWLKTLLKKGLIRSNGISATGGGANSNYFVSFKTEEDTGIIKDLDGFKRTTGRVNLGVDANNWLSFKINTGVSHTFSTEPRDRNNVQNPFSAMYSYNPYEPLFKKDAKGNPSLDSNGNPEYNLTHQGFSLSEAIKNNTSIEEILRFIASFSADFKAIKNVIYTPQISLTYTTLRAESYIKPGSVLDGYIGDANAPGSKTDNGNNSFTYNFLNKINYTNSFEDKHNIGATIFTEFYNNNFRFYSLGSKGFPTPDLNTQDNSSEPTIATTSRSELTLFSIGGVLDYNF
ncbi:MAG: SusC/RagA family TonB-linked outer membrane protein, partial [Polaribacter sp.]